MCLLVLIDKVTVIFVSLQMGITSRDDCTPVLLVQNISQHLNGTARTIGAALVGHFGE